MPTHILKSSNSATLHPENSNIQTIGCVDGSGVLTEDRTRKKGHSYVFIKMNDYYRKILFNDILFLEAAGSYCTLFMTSNHKHCISFNLSEMENWLPLDIFVRVHRSFLVNLNQIDSLVGNTLCIGKHRIPISKNYRGLLFDQLNIVGKLT